MHRLVARKIGDEIVLEGMTPDGKPERWRFYEVTPRRCRWRGDLSFDGGHSWFVAEEMILTRHGVTSRAA